MNRLLYLLLLVVCSQTLSAQQLPLFTQYRSNQGLINPASINGDYFVNGNNLAFGASYRKQWGILEAAPTTQTLHGEYFQPSTGAFNFLAGGYLMSDQTGPTGFTGIYGRFAGVLADNPKYAGLSLGLNLGVVQYKVDGNMIRLKDAGDAIGNAGYNQWYPDAGLGAFAYTMLDNGFFDDDYVFVGLSVPQVIGLDLEFETEDGSFNTRRVQHFYAQGGLYHFINDESFVEVSTWVKYVPAAPVNIDLNVRYQMAGNFWGGLGYSTSRNLHLEAGFILGGNIGFTNTIKAGYGFDYSISEFGPYAGSTHELNLSVSLAR